MAFVGRVLRDAVALLVSTPADLMLAVAGLFVVGAVLALTGASPLLGLAFDFLGSTLLAAGLVGRPEPDGFVVASRRLGQRLAPALGQLLAVVGLIIVLALVISIVVAVVTSVAAPGLAQRITDLGRDPAAARDPAVAGFVLLVVLGFMLLTGRLLPSTGLVLDRPVGAVESLRLAWASTRRRTIACMVLLLVATAPSWLLALFLPPTAATFFSILTVTFAVSVGVAAYRLLFPANEPTTGAQ